ncbi:MAG: class I SAM-dependent methyltransferase [Sandaracinaceae bacterium]
MMPSSAVSRLYERYYAGGKARAGVFTAVAEWLQPTRALYPGSFVHMTASFSFRDVTYLDTDRRAARFFSESEAVRALVHRHKRYPEEPKVRFHHASYETPQDETDESFDLLVSLYAGFISAPCKRYLAKGGVLLVNNSHGDAGLASIDPDWELVGALSGRGDRLRVREDGLDAYFVPKRDEEVTEARLRSTGRGVAYTKTAPAYLCRRVV